jgi:hypothetical protein
MIWPAKDHSNISIMLEIFVQPLVGACALCLIMIHIQVVVDSPDHCAWLAGNVQLKIWCSSI